MRAARGDIKWTKDLFAMSTLPDTGRLVTAALIWCAAVQPAAAADCVVGAYDAYHQATQRTNGPSNRTLSFKCKTYWEDEGRVRFEAKSGSGLSCSGNAEGAHSDPARMTMELFATPGASVWTENGWHITGYVVTGGEIEKRRRRDSLILFDVLVPGTSARFNYTVTSITFSKKEGKCDNVLEGALTWAD